MRAVQLERLESLAPLPTGQGEQRLVVLGEQVEGDEHDRDLPLPVEHAPAKTREAGEQSAPEAIISPS